MKDRVKRLETHLTEFKKDIDAVIDALTEEEQTRNRKLANPDGRYSQQYLDEYAKNWMSSHDYEGVLKDIREKHSKIIEDDLRDIQGAVDEVFNADPAPGFASKITAYYSLGMANELTSVEFEGLKRQARTYSELRLLQRLAASRTRIENHVKTDGNGELQKEQREAPNPYRMDIPNIESTYKSLEDFSRMAQNIISSYVGDNLGRVPKNNPVKLGLADSSSKYFKNGWSEGNRKWMEDVNALAALNPPRAHELTDRERRMNSILSDYADYPTLAPQKACEVVRALPELREQFLADERFRDAIMQDEKKVG